MTTETKPPRNAAASKSRDLKQPPIPIGKTRDQMMAQIATDGVVANARTMLAFSAPSFGELSLTDCALVLKETAHSLNQGDMSAAVKMLAAQAVALNSMFGELARLGQANLFKSPDYADRCMRLAFKAQGQSRATLETLAAIKSPPMVFARQANINNGGQQQVNNGPNIPPVSAHPGETASKQNELLEDLTDGSTQLDTRATAAAGRANMGLEPVGAVNRTANT